MNFLLFSIAWASLGPIFVLFLFLMDIVFIINTTILEPIAYILSFCVDVSCLTTTIDQSYEVLF